VYTTGGEIVTGGMLGTETRVLSRPAARKSLEERGLPGCYLGAPRAEATSTVVDMARSAETGENGRVASPWGSGGRLKIAPDIADQHLTPLLDDTFDLFTEALSKATNSSFLPPSVDVLTKLDDLFAVATWAVGRYGGGATELSTVHGGRCLSCCRPARNVRPPAGNQDGGVRR
jgi:hypothetical protein